jgi:accessory gene regulator protein AgrB
MYLLKKKQLSLNLKLGLDIILEVIMKVILVFMDLQELEYGLFLGRQQ